MNWPKTIKFLVLGVVVFASYVMIGCIGLMKAHPGPMGKSFDGFFQSKAVPSKFHRINAGGQTCLYVTGPMTPLWFISLPSGTPCYVFNTNGVLIEWTKDCGDDFSLNTKWSSPLRSGVEIFTEEARREFQRKAVALSNG